MIYFSKTMLVNSYFRGTNKELVRASVKVSMVLPINGNVFLNKTI